MNRTASGICLTPLTKAGANDRLRAVKHDDDFDMLRVVLVGDEPSRRNPQPGGREPLPKGANPKIHKRIVRAHKEGFVSHFARYEFDAKYRRDCIDNEIPKELYVRRYDKESKREWYELAESFVISEAEDRTEEE